MLRLKSEDVKPKELRNAEYCCIGFLIDSHIAVMNPIAELIGTVIKVLALLGFKYERVVVELPMVMAIFALLFLTTLFK